MSRAADGLRVWVRETAFSNVQDAVDSATNAGDAVYVKHGTYTNSAQIEITNAVGVTIKGGYAGNTVGGPPGDLTNEPTALTQSGASRILYIDASTAVLSRITISGGSLLGPNWVGTLGAGVWAKDSMLTMSNCIVERNACNANRNGNSYGFGGGFYVVSSRLTIDASVLQSNTSWAVDNYNHYKIRGGGVYAATGSRVIARHSRFFANQLQGTAPSYGGAVYLDGGSGHTFDNCLVVCNDVLTSGDGLYLNVAGTLLRNCTVADNTGSGVDASGGSASLTNCILWGNGVDATGSCSVVYGDVENPGLDVTTDSCLSVDPLFVDAAAGDYHLQSEMGSWHGGAWARDDNTSPCIDAADPATPRTGLEPVPHGGKVNMGAYGNTVQASKTPIMGTVFMIR